MSNPSIEQMLEAHVQMNCGVYFSEICPRDGLILATSDLIRDFYWNFGYTHPLREINISELNLIKTELTRLGRRPVVWKPETMATPIGWDVVSSEAWMWLDANSSAPMSPESHSNLEIRSSDIPTPEMREVFQSAYSSGGVEGSVGYFKLPMEYSEAYFNGRVRHGTQQRHFAGWLDGRCVSIASISIWNGIAGLYSVGTAHDFRRRGFALQLSRAASAWAFNNGCKGILLQTEAGSAVEQMYSKLQYQRTHIGQLIALPE